MPRFRRSSCVPTWTWIAEPRGHLRRTRALLHVAFHAAGSGQGWPGYLPFDVLIDGRRVSPRNQSDPRVSPETAVIGGLGDAASRASRRSGAVRSSRSRRQVPIRSRLPGGAMTATTCFSMTFASRAPIRSCKAALRRGRHRVRRERRTLPFSSGRSRPMPRAFGLQVVAYEAGWSVGGDLEQSPIQNWSKLHDPRVKAINDEAIELWDRSGSFLAVWGRLRILAHLRTLPMRTAIPSWRASGRQGSACATKPRTADPSPTILRPGDADWSYQAEAAAPWWQRFVPWMRPDIAEWHAWMLIAPKTGSSELVITGSGDWPSASRGRRADAWPLEAAWELRRGVFPSHLTRGAHAVRVVIVGGDLEIQEIEIR